MHNVRFKVEVFPQPDLPTQLSPSSRERSNASTPRWALSTLKILHLLLRLAQGFRDERVKRFLDLGCVSRVQSTQHVRRPRRALPAIDRESFRSRRSPSAWRTPAQIACVIPCNFLATITNIPSRRRRYWKSVLNLAERIVAGRLCELCPMVSRDADEYRFNPLRSEVSSPRVFVDRLLCEFAIGESSEYLIVEQRRERIRCLSCTYLQ